MVKFTRSVSAGTVGGAASATEQPVYIHLGETQAWANIIRNDYPVPAFEIDESIIDEIITGPSVVNKVVSQSIAPGTVVSRGTQIELTLAPPSKVPGRIIRDGHIALAEMSMEDVYNQIIRDNAGVVAVLNRNPNVERMSTSDQALVAAAAEEQGIEISDDPGRSIGNMTTSLHLARTMMEV